jgi:hypothetical protein
MASGVAGSDDVCGEPVPLGGIDSLSAMEVYEEHHDLEEVRSLLGHARLETTQLYARYFGTDGGAWVRRLLARYGDDRVEAGMTAYRAHYGEIGLHMARFGSLNRPFDPAELRRIKRLWVRHSIAEDARDIDGLIATLSEDCVYEVVPSGQRWVGHDGARSFYTELFGAFPDNAFALTEIVIGPQGAFEVATLTGTNLGPWAGALPSGLPVSLEVIILFPWDPVTQRFTGERIWFDRGALED